MTLKRKAIRSSVLVFAKKLFQSGTNFISKIILAWLLVPADFGLVAIASLVVDGIGLIREMGLNSALIYKKDDEDLAADTAFLIIWTVSIFLYVVTFLLAPFAASFFGDSTITLIIWVSSLSYIITAFGFVPMTLLEKRIDFKRYTLIEIVGSIVGFSATILMAFFGFGVWSLVYGGLIAGVSGSLGVWFLTPWRPKFRFDKKIAKELIHYGKFMVGVIVVVFLIQNVDNAFVGKILGTSMLGIYAMAYSICNLPANTVMQTINQVLFPTYTKLQGDKEKLKAAYLKVFNLVSLLVFPISLGIFITAPAAVGLVLSEKWLPAVPVVQVLCFFGLFRSLAGTTGEMFKALGDPAIIFKSYGAQLILMLLLLYPATAWFGIVGTGVAVTFSMFLFMVWLLSTLCRRLKIGYISLVEISSTHLAASLVMVLGVYFTGIALGVSLLSLGASISLGAVIYFIVVYTVTGGKVISDIKEVTAAIKTPKDNNTQAD